MERSVLLSGRSRMEGFPGRASQSGYPVVGWRIGRDREKHASKPSRIAMPAANDEWFLSLQKRGIDWSQAIIVTNDREPRRDTLLLLCVIKRRATRFLPRIRETSELHRDGRSSTQWLHNVVTTKVSYIKYFETL